MKKVSQVSITKQRAAYNKTNGICVICGKKLSDDENLWSVDHSIPRAIYKWIKDDDEARSIIESEKNIFIVHPYCNFAKDSFAESVLFITKYFTNLYGIFIKNIWKKEGKR